MTIRQFQAPVRSQPLTLSNNTRGTDVIYDDNFLPLPPRSGFELLWHQMSGECALERVGGHVYCNGHRLSSMRVRYYMMYNHDVFDGWTRLSLITDSNGIRGAWQANEFAARQFEQNPELWPDDVDTLIFSGTAWIDADRYINEAPMTFSGLVYTNLIYVRVLRREGNKIISDLMPINDTPQGKKVVDLTAAYDVDTKNDDLGRFLVDYCPEWFGKRVFGGRMYQPYRTLLSSVSFGWLKPHVCDEIGRPARPSLYWIKPYTPYYGGTGS